MKRALARLRDDRLAEQARDEQICKAIEEKIASATHGWCLAEQAPTQPHTATRRID
jgi:hypothetical protein